MRKVFILLFFVLFSVIETFAESNPIFLPLSPFIRDYSHSKTLGFARPFALPSKYASDTNGVTTEEKKNQYCYTYTEANFETHLYYSRDTFLVERIDILYLDESNSVSFLIQFLWLNDFGLLTGTTTIFNRETDKYQTYILNDGLAVDNFVYCIAEFLTDFVPNTSKE